MTNQTLLEHVADIVSAHVGNNAVSANDVAWLIQSVHASLAALGEAPAPDAEKPAPAVSIRASVKSDLITCLDCGAKMKMIKRHIGIEHGLTPAEYRTRWNLPGDYPMVAPEYAARRRDLAVKIGLGRKPGQSKKVRGSKDAK